MIFVLHYTQGSIYIYITRKGGDEYLIAVWPYGDIYRTTSNTDISRKVSYTLMTYFRSGRMNNWSPPLNGHQTTVCTLNSSSHTKPQRLFSRSICHQHISIHHLTDSTEASNYEKFIDVFNMPDPSQPTINIHCTRFSRLFVTMPRIPYKTLCYIFEKPRVQGHQHWYSQLSNTQIQIHKYANTA